MEATHLVGEVIFLMQEDLTSGCNMAEKTVNWVNDLLMQEYEEPKFATRLLCSILTINALMSILKG